MQGICYVMKARIDFSEKSRTRQKKDKKAQNVTKK